MDVDVLAVVGLADLDLEVDCSVAVRIGIDHETDWRRFTRKGEAAGGG